ncbi:hypothetical protein CYMTET_28353 [Cymbomonas tetramitiformis]|uniref:Uncharacterized protein n=1 Tax=Cymbomonas tetramitiformis TaxID=36881 RepID=A0AAE0FN99_9CHLO|nr:hypothetical protein CYMTET_28353 [Cymbomonas tetramitiformis]
MASTPYHLIAPARLRARPAGASKRQYKLFSFDQLSATPTASASSQSPAEKKFDLDAGTLLDDQPRLEALVKGVKAKLCGRGDVIDEWRFCGDESNARLLLDSLVEELLTSRLTSFNSLFAAAFRLEDATAAVVPNANKLLKELLETSVLALRSFQWRGPQKVELTVGVDPNEFLRAFTESINGASTDLGHDSRFNLGRDISIRLLLRRTCPVTYVAVHEKSTDEEIAKKPALTLVSSGLAIQRVYNNSDKTRVLNNALYNDAGRHHGELGGRDYRGAPDRASPLPVMFTTLAARYQAAYEHSEEACQAVCWEHGTPDICDVSESVRTYPDDGFLSFAAYLTQWDEAAHSPAWGSHGCADSEWDAWDSDPYTQEPILISRNQSYQNQNQNPWYDKNDLQREQEGPVALNCVNWESQSHVEWS